MVIQVVETEIGPIGSRGLHPFLEIFTDAP